VLYTFVYQLVFWYQLNCSFLQDRLQSVLNAAARLVYTRVGHQSTPLNCFGSFTGYAFRRESSSGCVFWHITVCTAPHRRIWLTVCVWHQRMLLVVVCALSTLRLRRCWSRQPVHQLSVGDHAFPMAATRASNSLPPQTRAASSLLTFRRETKSHLFLQSLGWQKSGAGSADWQLNCQHETCNIICAFLLSAPATVAQWWCHLHHYFLNNNKIIIYSRFLISLDCNIICAFLLSAPATVA